MTGEFRVRYWDVDWNCIHDSHPTTTWKTRMNLILAYAAPWAAILGTLGFFVAVDTLLGKIK